MKYRIFLWLFVQATLSTHAQEIVSLRSIPFLTAYAKDIHVAAVTDKRVVKNLGIQRNTTADYVTLSLNGGAASAIKTFYDLTFKEDSTSTAIYLQIQELNVQASIRRMNNGITRVARVHVSLVFLEKRGGVMKELFRIKHNEDEVFALDDQQGLYRTHEKRIRAALEYCMHVFLNNYQRTKDQISLPDFEPTRENDQLEAKLGQWFNLVTMKGMQSRYFAGYGISYTGFVDNKKGLIRPYETSLEVTWARSDVAQENGYAEVNSFIFRPELYFFYKRLFKGAYATMSTNVPVGFELLEDLEGNNSFNFIIGLGASQGLRLIPWQDKGVVFGVDFFQQLETSKVYTFDLGLELVLGVNF